MQHPIPGLILALALALVSFSSCNETADSAPGEPFTYETLRPDLTDTTLSFGQLRLYPIYALEGWKEQEGRYGHYLTLDKALQLAKVEVSEKSIGDSTEDEVNTLFVENLSSDTVLLLAGEVIKGGKQDRTLATDVLLPPGRGKVDLQVFCVEQGRWTEKEENRIPDQAGEEKKFKKTGGVVKTSVRKEAMVAKAQGKVWEEVDEANTKAGNRSQTSAYTSFESNTDYRAKEGDYLAFFIQRIPGKKDMLGFVAVTGNRVMGCEVFATRAFFCDACPRILPSFINEAITDGAPLSVSTPVLRSYCDRLFGNKAEQNKYLANNGNLFLDKGRPVHMVAY